MKTTMTKFASWVKRPASIMQFWRPQSGLLGGMLFALILLNIALLLLWMAN